METLRLPEKSNRPNSFVMAKLLKLRRLTTAAIVATEILGAGCAKGWEIPDSQVYDGSDTECNPGETRDCYEGPEVTKNVGICHSGTQTCDDQGQYGPCMNQQLPEIEICLNGKDDDCDGRIDKNDTDATDIVCCTPGEKQACYDGDPATRNIGNCHDGTITCNPDGKSWTTVCEDQQLPTAEVCHFSDNVLNPKNDEDCNGRVDDGYDGITQNGCVCLPGSVKYFYNGPVGTQNVGVCHAGEMDCWNDGTGWQLAYNQVIPGPEECGNLFGIDYSCDGNPPKTDPDCNCLSTVTGNVEFCGNTCQPMFVCPPQYNVPVCGSYDVCQ